MSYKGLPDVVTTRRRNLLESAYFTEIARGLAVTGRHLIRNLFNTDKMPTVQYPDQKRDYGPRFRGRHRLTQREDGSPRCVACMMCSTVCPADCIEIIAGEHPDPTIEKYSKEFNIDLLRCVYCGLCEEACPCDAIRMDTGIYEIAAETREAFVVNKDFLLNNDKDGTL
ncbi:4Fe-4S dicluster domain-containing protein [bacterium]|nr:4Fe-4S dicluster domain-containing protein [bacterium]